MGIIIIMARNRWLGDKEFACLCRRSGFDPWAGKIPPAKEMATHSSILPEKSHGQRSLADYIPCGCKRVGHDTQYISVISRDAPTQAENQSFV